MISLQSTHLAMGFPCSLTQCPVTPDELELSMSPLLSTTLLQMVVLRKMLPKRKLLVMSPEVMALRQMDPLLMSLTA